jgi:hypothetical protein
MLVLVPVTRFAAFMLVAAVPSLCFASEGTTLELRWAAPPACPTGESVQREVARLEGRHTALTALRATVLVRAVPTGWSAELRTESNGVRGERVLEAGDCAQLADAAALVIAMAHCPELASGEAPNETPAPRESPQLFLGAFASGDLGSLLNPSFGAGLELSLEFERFEVRALALRSLAQSRLAGPTVDSTIEVQAQLGLGLRGCWLPLRGRLSLGPCAGVDGWLISTTTRNISVPSTGTGWWLGGVAGVTGKLRLFERLALTLAVEVGAAAMRPVFVVDGYGQVFRPNEVVGRARAGLEVRLW